MEKVERNQLVVELRKQGITYKSIGQQVGVGAERVRQILKRAERIKERCSRFGAMSTRAINCLKNSCWYDLPGWNRWPEDEEITPQMVAENCTRKKLAECPNLGKHTIQEIENWLAEHNLKLSE